MNILHLTHCVGNSNCGGWGRYAEELSDALKASGHTVFFSVHERYEESEYVTLPSPLSFKKAFFLSFWYAFGLWRTFRKKRIDVIHITAEPYVFIGFLASIFLRVPYVVTVHGSRGVLPLQNPLFSAFQKVGYARAKKVACVSRFTEKKLLEYVSLKNTTVILNGVNRESFSPLKNIKKEKHTLLFVGALKFRKGLHVLIPAVSLIKETYPDVHLNVVGNQSDTEYVARIKELVKNHNLTDHVSFFEGISDEDLKTLYAKSSLFILPSVTSREHFEGFGLVYLEANAQGVPAIGTRGTAADESINDGVSGLLVEENNSSDIAKTVLSVFSNSTLYTSLETGSKKWAAKFDWRYVAKKYTDIFTA